jgi:hypothetical protein
MGSSTCSKGNSPRAAGNSTSSKGRDPSAMGSSTCPKGNFPRAAGSSTSSKGRDPSVMGSSTCSKDRSPRTAGKPPRGAGGSPQAPGSCPDFGDRARLARADAHEAWGEDREPRARARLARGEAREPWEKPRQVWGEDRQPWGGAPETRETHRELRAEARESQARPHEARGRARATSSSIAARTVSARDAIRLIAKVKDIDIDATRGLLRRFLGPGLLGRLEECLRRAGHPWPGGLTAWVPDFLPVDRRSFLMRRSPAGSAGILSASSRKWAKGPTFLGERWRKRRVRGCGAMAVRRSHGERGPARMPALPAGAKPSQ